MKVHPRAELIVAGARACVGTQFRVQGRLPSVGLDCVGVVVCAAAAAGIRLADMADYSLRGEQARRLAAALAGWRRVERGTAGDVLVVAPAVGARHVGVMTAGGLVHAHAGLRRVVEGPVDPDWRVIGLWRLPEE